MPTLSRRSFFASAAIALAATTGASLWHRGAAARALAPVDTERSPGIALSGHDPVAYFTSRRPVPGLGTITTTWNGAEWRFANEENRAQFLRDPTRYAPQFGGYCSWAVSRGYTASGDPEAWTIHEGKLYINYSPEVQQEWLKAMVENIRKGEQNWPGLIGRR